ncbi:hypothetical protein [Roseomonas fluvialis]|uniref:Carbonic anhydrase n=1 Tax=Roseomonas fluvialis TaxID=1750527 RepID=A0ABM7XY07_9PROT|nr:hypothetical protein [Roseomonas fluvialis]BDG70371.1 hypothetical protein Rmf_03000 [Roseomonas fluvialis]
MRTCTDAMPRFHHAPGCGCTARPGRRAVLGLLAAAGIARGAAAGSGQYEAMLLNCIDPRFTTGSFLFMSSHGLRDRYSQFTIAGGPIGVVHPRFASWHQAFWDNLGVTVQLHGIRQVMAMTHRDCGAAKLAFGDAAVATRAQETATHAEALTAFRAEAARRQPELQVVTAIMDLDGTIQRVG